MHLVVIRIGPDIDTDCFILTHFDAQRIVNSAFYLLDARLIGDVIYPVLIETGGMHDEIGWIDVLITGAHIFTQQGMQGGNHANGE